MYAIGEAAVYLGVPRSTLRTWVRGHDYRVQNETRTMKPLIKADPSGLLSFNNLTEAYVLASLTRRFDLPLQRVRTALNSMRAVSNASISTSSSSPSACIRGGANRARPVSSPSIRGVPSASRPSRAAAFRSR